MAETKKEAYTTEDGKELSTTQFCLENEMSLAILAGLQMFDENFESTQIFDDAYYLYLPNDESVQHFKTYCKSLFIVLNNLTGTGCYMWSSTLGDFIKPDDYCHMLKEDLCITEAKKFFSSFEESSTNAVQIIDGRKTVVLENGKYKIQYDESNSFPKTVLRYDEFSRDIAGDNVIFNLCEKIEELENNL